MNDRLEIITRISQNLYLIPKTKFGVLFSTANMFYDGLCRHDGLSSTGGIETFNRCAATSTQLNQCLLLPHRLHLINNRTRISLIDLLEFILFFQDWITMRMSHPSHSAFYNHIGNRCMQDRRVRTFSVHAGKGKFLYTQYIWIF